MRFHAKILILCLIISNSLGWPVSAAEKLAIATNQSRVLSFNGIQRVAIANPDIADVVVISSSEALIIGKATGTTTLYIWLANERKSYLVEVTADDLPIATDIKRILGYTDIKVSKVNKTIIIEGRVNGQYQKNRAEQVASAYAEKVINLLEITRPTQVKIEAKIIEINRDKTKNLGISWGNDVVSSGIFNFGQKFLNPILKSAPPAGTVLGGLGGYAAINGQLALLVKNGTARILSQPHMVTLSGEKANIMIGGQIPVPISVQNGQVSIQWKDYGVKLNIVPEVNYEGLIQSSVKAEVSSLDWNSTHKIQIGPNMYIPPIKMTQAEAVIAMSSGQTLAIGGLISNTVTEDLTKVPVLCDLPIIGNLFKSKSFTCGEAELIILITPTIIKPDNYLPLISEEMREKIAIDKLGGVGDSGENKDTYSR